MATAAMQGLQASLLAALSYLPPYYKGLYSQSLCLSPQSTICLWIKTGNYGTVQRQFYTVAFFSQLYISSCFHVGIISTT